MNKERTRDFVVMALLALLCIVVYGRCLAFESTLYDDPKIIFENPHVQAGLTWDSIRWAVLHPNLGLYMPLPTLTFMLDRELFGDWAGGYHGMTLAWHVLCVCLFYWVMRRLTGNFAAVLLASVLVAVHPVQAMTVNWVSARNEIMPAVFLLLSIDMYRRYCGMRNAEFGMRNAEAEGKKAEGRRIKAEGGSGKREGERYLGKAGRNDKNVRNEGTPGGRKTPGIALGTGTAADSPSSPAASAPLHPSPFILHPFLYFFLAVLFMLLGIFCKQGIVVLPAVLLLLDYWPLGRIDLSFRETGRTLRRAAVLVLEKLPFFAVSAVGAAFAVYGKREFGLIRSPPWSPCSRISVLPSPPRPVPGAPGVSRALYHGLLRVVRRPGLVDDRRGRPAPGGAYRLCVDPVVETPWIVVFWGWFVLFLFP